MSLTLIIVGFTALISIQAFNSQQMYHALMHHPFTEKREGQWYRFVTSGFVHGSWGHLLINMFVLWQFGTIVEEVFTVGFATSGQVAGEAVTLRNPPLFGPTLGRVVFILLYLACIVIGDLPSYYKHQDNPQYAAIGASGGVSGILFAFVVFQPWDMLLLYFIIPIPAVLAAVLYLVYSSWAARNSNDNIGHDAHFWGAVTGFVGTLVLAPAQIPLFFERLMEFDF